MTNSNVNAVWLKKKDKAFLEELYASIGELNRITGVSNLVRMVENKFVYNDGFYFVGEYVGDAVLLINLYQIRENGENQDIGVIFSQFPLSYAVMYLRGMIVATNAANLKVKNSMAVWD